MLTSINTSATQYRDVFVRMSASLWLHTCSFEWSPGVTAVCGDLIAWSSIFNSAVHSEGWTHLHMPPTHCTRNLSCSCLAVIQGLWCQSDFSFSGKNICSSNTSQSLQTPGGAAKHWEDYDSFCFSSAFDTFLQSLWLAEMLSVKQVNQNLQAWIPGYLTDRPQYIRMLGCLSDVVMGNTGTPRELYCQDFVGWRDRDRHCSIPAWGQCKRHCVMHQIVKHKLNKEPPGCMGEAVRVPLSQSISCLNQ